MNTMPIYPNNINLKSQPKRKAQDTAVLGASFVNQ